MVRGIGLALTALLLAAPVAAQIGTPPVVFDRMLVGAMTPAARTSFGDGIWRIGQGGVKPGLYRTPGKAGCYWAILRNFRGGILDNNFTSRKAPQIVELLRADAGFESRDCGIWRRL